MPAANDFKIKVEELVAAIPNGKVMTYGQIAALAGNAKAARVVGGIAHYGDPNMPWHRVVNKKGGLASGYPGGRENHKKHLREEGVEVNDNLYINISKHLWQPEIQ